VRNDSYGRMLHNQPDGHGYTIATLSSAYRAVKRIRVHRLVVSIFLGLLNDTFEDVDHKDKNRANNALENLEPVTRQENVARARGVPVVQKDAATGYIIAEFNSINDAARRAKVNAHTLWNSISGQTERMRGNHIWERLEAHTDTCVDTNAKDEPDPEIEKLIDEMLSYM
jgi:hypothetical protein